MNLGFKGRFKVVVEEPDGSSKDYGWQDNLITDIGLDALANPYQDLRLICTLGSSDTPASPSDIGCHIGISQGVYRNAIVESRGINAEGYMSNTHKYTFNAGQIMDGFVREICVGWGMDYTSAFSRMVLAEEIPVTTNSIMHVEHELRVYPATGTTVATVNGLTTATSCINETDTTVWFVPNTGVNLNGVYVHVIDGNNTSLVVLQTVESNVAYIANSHYKDFEIGIGPTYFASEDIASIYLGTYNGFLGFQKMEFNPHISKLGNQSIRFNFRFSWGRYGN